MDHESRIGRRVARLVTAERSDPMLSQAALLGPVVVLGVVIAVVAPAGLGHPALLSGLAVLGTATVLCAAVPWGRLPAGSLMVVPLLDMVAVGLMRLTPERGGLAALVVFPAIWLGLAFRTRGVLVATLTSIVVLTAPGLYQLGFGAEGWTMAILLPIITFAIALTTSVTSSSWVSHSSRLQRQGDALERLLRQVNQQRQITDAIVQTVDVGLLAVGPDGTYSSMNPRHRQMIRLAYPDGHAGRAGQVGEVYEADGVTLVAQQDLPSSRGVRGEEFSDYTIWIGRDPASRRALSVSSRSMRDGSGEHVGAVLAYHDITELMHAVQVKDEFVASVSHELRTPLTSIIGYVDLIADHADQLPPEVVRYLSVVDRNAQRLLLLVTDLLSTAQFEAGSVRLQTEQVALEPIVEQSLVAARECAAGAQVELVGDVSPVPTVLADPRRIAQVVDNLLSNAVKYTPAGGRVRVQLEKGEGEVRLVVEDTGIGMSREDVDRLFTKFFRARTAEERAIPGVGLGLVISKAIVDAHRGSIEVTSEEGVGTTARVTLPLASG